MRVRAPGVCGVGRVGSGRVIGRRRLGHHVRGNPNRLRGPRTGSSVGRLRRGLTMPRALDLRGGDAGRVDPAEV